MTDTEKCEFYERVLNEIGRGTWEGPGEDHVKYLRSRAHYALVHTGGDDEI